MNEDMLSQLHEGCAQTGARIALAIMLASVFGQIVATVWYVTEGAKFNATQLLGSLLSSLFAFGLFAAALKYGSNWLENNFPLVAGVAVLSFTLETFYLISLLDLGLASIQELIYMVTYAMHQLSLIVIMALLIRLRSEDA